jgi:nucleotide-binding universal stress UspA family protein
MNSFETLLVAVDGSDCASRAVRVAGELATTVGADVHVVAVAGGELDEDAAETVVADAVEALDDVDVVVDGHVETGRPARAVVGLADDVAADLLVVGRSGHGGGILGSTTDRVLRRTDRHVLTVGEAGGPDAYETVLLPTDGSGAAGMAIGPAVDLAREYGAALHVLSAVDPVVAAGPFSAGGVDQAYVERLREQAADTADGVADECEARADGALDVTAVGRTGQPSTEIADYVEEAGVDLVVMGSTGESSLTGQLLGSTADRVLRTVDVPVLVVRRGD